MRSLVATMLLTAGPAFAQMAPQGVPAPAMPPEAAAIVADFNSMDTARGHVGKELMTLLDAYGKALADLAVAKARVKELEGASK